MSPLKIFLVEDSPLMQDRLNTLIGEISNVTVIAQCNSESEALLGIAETHPDLVILDLNIAQGHGMSVLWKTKQAHPEIKVIVLTNLGDLQYHKKCHRMGADYFFDKSKDFGKFVATLKNLAEGLVVPDEVELPT